MLREVEMILEVRPDLKEYKFIPVEDLNISIPKLEINSAGKYAFGEFTIFLDTKLKDPELGTCRFGVNDEIKTVADKLT